MRKLFYAINSIFNLGKYTVPKKARKSFFLRFRGKLVEGAYGREIKYEINLKF